MNKGMYEKVLEDAVDFFTSGYEDGQTAAEKPDGMAADATSQGQPQGDGKDVPRMKDC